MYNLAIAFYALVARLISPFHRKARLMIRGQKQTFGILQSRIDTDAKYIWVHAASLGEFEQGRPLIEKIKEIYPEYKILLTFFSPSGYEIRKNYDKADIVCYLPFDLPKNAKQFLSTVKPRITIFIKYEFWMNYLTQLQKLQIPTFIISAIFRPDQIFFRSYADGYRHVLDTFDHFFVQDIKSQELLAKHGKTNVSVCGDTRFDRVIDIQKQSKKLPLIDIFASLHNAEKKHILIAGSSWTKDEDIFIPFFNEHPEIKLIIAPHEVHEDHIKEITSKLDKPYLLYSQANEENIKTADCLIIDSIGLLSSIYNYGNIAYIGGGFGTGIHNVLEAAVYGIPVIFGPNFHKFREARKLIDSGGACSINDKTEFDKKMNELVHSREYMENYGKNAGDFVKQNTGATERILKEIQPVLIERLK